jgi:hypothetical protein
MQDGAQVQVPGAGGQVVIGSGFVRAERVEFAVAGYQGRERDRR